MRRVSKQARSIAKPWLQKRRKAVGLAIKTMRHYRGLTAEEFIMENPCMSLDNYYRIENGRSSPTMNSLIFVLNGLGFSWEIFGKLVDRFLVDESLVKLMSRGNKYDRENIVSAVSDVCG